MSFNLIRVLVCGVAAPGWLAGLKLADAATPHEAADFDVRRLPDDRDLARNLVEFRPQVILTIGEPRTFAQLWSTSLETRKRWITIPNTDVDPAVVAERIMVAFTTNVSELRFPEQPLISVFTPTFLTGSKLQRPWRSLLAQTYCNWEWVTYDDSPDNGATFAQLLAICQQDSRVSAFRGQQPSGRIGEVKHWLCGLAKGDLLLELDHDDALTPNALRDLVDASHAFPDAGFFYSDCAEVFESGEAATYSDGWGMGYGSYRDEVLGGQSYRVAVCPDLNAKTIRHIVGVPNHFRAWTRRGYNASGGYSPELHVCDDYELLIRTFLTSRMVHIQRFGYIQYHNNASSGNTQRNRNGEIQRLVRYLRAAYGPRIHARLLELGVEDFLWREGGELDWDAVPPQPTPFANERFS